MIHFSPELERIVKTALAEDIGAGDVTTAAAIPPGASARGCYFAKDSGVLCGVDVAAYVYSLLDGSIVFTKHFNDGDRIASGDVIAEVSGPAAPLLTGERVGLNLMRRLSGIATATAAAGSWA